MLRRCLERIRCQTPAPRKVIIFDNGSSDGSAVEARQEFSEFEFVMNMANVGFARANNLGAQLCEGCEWLLLVNPDAFPEPDCLAKLLAAAEANPAFAVFAPLIVTERDTGVIDSAGDDYLKSGIGRHRLQGRPRNAAASPCEVFSASAAAALYRRDAFVAVGGFDESLFAYYEDVDLGVRLRLAGYRTLYVPDAVVHHVSGGVTGGEWNRNSLYYGQRNFILVYFSNMPWPLFWRGLPFHVWAVLRGLAKACMQGHGRLVARATWDACMGVPPRVMERWRGKGPGREAAAGLKALMS